MPRERTKFTKERPVSADSIEANWRLFVAIDVPEIHRDTLEALLAIARDRNPAVRWIAANAAHLTLQFLGEVPIETAELLRMAFPAAGKSVHRFSLRADGAGAFPDLRTPQIVWLGLAGDVSKLRRLHRAVETFLLGYDLEAETREFKPHITLGRARAKLQSPEINTLIETMRSPEVKALLTRLEEPFRIEQITLYRSHLSKDGSTYEPLATAALTS
jgi:RNA 2',3'-cyclic 3'-phosphodiesterase